MTQFDQTLLAAVKGYAWLPDLRRQSHGEPVDMRVLGRPAVGICGTDATRFFYGDGNLERHTALPHPVVSTLFGRGAVHTLDAEAHRHRKALFVTLLMGDGIDACAKLAGEAFDQAADTWRGAPPVTLFDEAARAIARGMLRWTGVPLGDDEADDFAADLVAMVDGFATVGPRHWRALAARHRQERRLAGLIEAIRSGEQAVAPDSAVARISAHVEDGRPLVPRVAAVELLNVIRPATAVAWLVAYAGHALHLQPRLRWALESGDQQFTTAFAHEIRRFYPFAPFLGGRATRDLSFAGHPIPAGTLVLLDVYGQNHDPELWPDPYAFRPERFLGRSIGEFDLIPQGGGDPRTGHRCPGEKMTMALLGTLSQQLARLDYHVPPQDLRIDLSRIPARPADGLRIVLPA